MVHHKRLLTENEKILLNILKKNIFLKYSDMRVFSSNYVLSLNDGEMGSFRFIYENQNELENLTIIPIAEYQFNDIDNIPVLVTLYAYENGWFYELDIWKSNFDYLLEYPKQI